MLSELKAPVTYWVAVPHADQHGAQSFGTGGSLQPDGQQQAVTGLGKLTRLQIAAIPGPPTERDICSV